MGRRASDVFFAVSVLKPVCFVLLAVALTACGEPGPMGPQGPAGPPGKEGQRGAAGSGLSTSIICTGVFNAGTSTYNMGLDVYRFADGSTLASCEVWGAGFAVRGLNLWRATQAGSVSGGCLIAADVDTASYGFWNFALTSSNAASGQYIDAGSPNNNRTAQLSCMTTGAP